MTEEQKAQFLALSAQHLRLLTGLYEDVQWRYWGRLVSSAFVIPQAALDSLSGVPDSAKSALRTAGIAIKALNEMAPLVPQGGAPHGSPENWTVVWVELAEATEYNLYTAMQGMSRTSAFTTMMEAWRRFAEIIKKALGAGGRAAEAIGGGAMVIGVWLILREIFGRKK